ncbi:hypothetical protein L484_012667 [Morus notabilis]|uniref:Uncharacterized protein n=1 Tax=Morus notabilis TaxID=981085 RepID=W9QD51_9ROSA|nr:hypothetical protein L484_012667 [Morus notabilis]
MRTLVMLKSLDHVVAMVLNSFCDPHGLASLMRNLSWQTETWTIVLFAVTLSSSTNCFMYMLQFSSNGEDRVVVGTLDVNQCIRLLDEIVGKKPQELERLLAVKEGTLPQQPASDDDISITLLVRMLDGQQIAPNPCGLYL